jgi:hypothetical protein
LAAALRARKRSDAVMPGVLRGEGAAGSPPDMPPPMAASPATTDEAPPPPRLADPLRGDAAAARFKFSR